MELYVPDTWTLIILLFIRSLTFGFIIVILSFAYTFIVLLIESIILP